MIKNSKTLTIIGLPLPYYLLIAALTAACMYTQCLPGGMVGGMVFLIVLGEGLNALGTHVPWVRTYLGGSVICILGSAILNAAGLIPQQTFQTVDTLVNDNGFLIFYISALITGSLFNIDRDLLLRATVRLLPVAFVSLFVGVTLSGLLGMVMGDRFWDGVLYIGIPMTSGGMTAGTVPLSGIYASVLGVDSSQLLTRMAPATVLGNCIAIVLAALVHRFGLSHPKISGRGLLVNDGRSVKTPPPVKPTLPALSVGLVLSMAFYQLGLLFHHFIPVVPTYAWMIIAIILCKSFRLLPASLEDGARLWGQFAIHCFTSAALAGIGVCLIDLNTILRTITPLYLLSTVLIVAAIGLSAGLAGKLVGFFPIESSIAAGLCTTNMGGSGNVAVLTSSERMELLPFAQIVTRSCGALMLTLGGILVQIVGK